MKSHLVTLLSAVLFFPVARSQVYSYLGDVNGQLRSIFENIAYPSNDIGFLYERSAKLADSVFTIAIRRIH